MTHYLIGIDLGTTNSCLAYVDMMQPRKQVHLLKVPQLIAASEVNALSTLPSFCYLSAPHEWSKGAINLPWKNADSTFVGSFAQTQGAKVPTRLVQSAKSWLCHSAAHRRDKILPLEAADEAIRLSPVEATAHYLRHLREAWNFLMAKGNVDNEFDAQEVILTVPASFDEVARSLTVEAAKMAGFVQITLLEEPQAAFYSWIAQHEGEWETQLPVGSTVLVCDVGGGTTDFSLIDVVEKGGKRAFERIAVGDHLLLGGDNIDHTIAHLIETKLGEREILNSMQRQQIRHEARKAKEVLLSDASKETYRVILQGSGSSVVQGTKIAELQRQEVEELLLKGFFGSYPWKEAVALQKTPGMRTMGLPYEVEPSITKHLAHFLLQGGSEGVPKKPDYVLFNGGTMKPTSFQQAILHSLHSWFPEKKVTLLSSYSLDLAVARGAAYYGMARHGLGVKIGGGVARSYYLLVEVKNSDGTLIKRALTLLPRGSEEGDSYEPDNNFLLMPNTPVSFQLCTSHTRLHDFFGDLIDIDPEEMLLLPPIHTILRYGKKGSDASQEKIPVHLQIHLTSIGTVEVGLKSLKSDHRWKLEFQVRSTAGQDNSLTMLSKRQNDETFDASHFKDAEEIIQQVFEKRIIKPELLMEKLEESLGQQRKEWSPSVLRGLADRLLKVSDGRKVSLSYAERWWNAIGFLLRPGFGYVLDDFRIKELWKIILNDCKNQLPQEVLIQLWICYRRIAGGLNKGQQTQLVGELMGALFMKGKIILKSKAELYPYSEKMRALVSFELIDTATKVRLGNALIDRICTGNAISVDYWALGRLAARHLLYGSLINVLPKEYCEQWINKLLEAPIDKNEVLAALLGMMARKTAHREVNVSKQCVEAILEVFPSLGDLLMKESSLSQQEQERIFGEQLPIGLQYQD